MLYLTSSIDLVIKWHMSRMCQIGGAATLNMCVSSPVTTEEGTLPCAHCSIGKRVPPRIAVVRSLIRCWTHAISERDLPDSEKILLNGRAEEGQRPFSEVYIILCYHCTSITAPAALNHDKLDHIPFSSPCQPCSPQCQAWWPPWAIAPFMGSEKKY